jgi:hypothetical protein
MATKCKCPNIGNYDRAEKGELILIALEPTSSVRNRCQPGHHERHYRRRRGRTHGIGILTLVLLGIIGFASWFLLRGYGAPASAPATPTSAPIPLPSAIPSPTPIASPPSTPPTTHTILRFHGSNTIGGKLLPALATAFLQQEG